MLMKSCGRKNKLLKREMEGQEISNTKGSVPRLVVVVHR